MNPSPLDRLLKKQATLFVALSTLIGSNLYIHNQLIAPANKYFGYEPIEITLPYLLTCPILIILTQWIIPSSTKKPSDFFLMIYGIFVIFFYGIYYPINGNIPLESVASNWLILALPALLLKLIIVTPPAIITGINIKREYFIYALVSVCLLTVYLAVKNRPESSGFDLSTSYIRRLQGRDSYPIKSLSAYLNMMVINGFAPFIAFSSVYYKKHFLWFFALTMPICFFYVLGLKAPFAYFFLATIFGYSAKKGRLNTFTNQIIVLLLAATIAATIEYWLFDYSFIADYFIRRALSVPTFTANYYFHLFQLNPAEWNWSQGLLHSKGITFYVGEVLEGHKGLNANTNTFLYQLGQNGFPGYIATVTLTTLFFIYIDSIYKAKKDNATIYVAFMFSLLIIEQAATTALFSSGLLILSIIVTFSYKNASIPKDTGLKATETSHKSASSFGPMLTNGLV